MTKPLVVDEAPLSEFVRKMRDACRRCLAASKPSDKRAIEREMADLMRKYLGRNAWEAAVAAEREAERVSADVPRATSRRYVRPGPMPKYSSGDFDHKLAAAGDRTDDDE